MGPGRELKKLQTVAAAAAADLRLFFFSSWVVEGSTPGGCGGRSVSRSFPLRVRFVAGNVRRVSRCVELPLAAAHCREDAPSDASIHARPADPVWLPCQIVEFFFGGREKVTGALAHSSRLSALLCFSPMARTSDRRDLALALPPHHQPNMAPTPSPARRREQGGRRGPSGAPPCSSAVCVFKSDTFFFLERYH